MSYILIEESVFRTLMNRIVNEEENDVRYDFTETDYWMNGKEVCRYLQISTALLNTYRHDRTLHHCKISETYHYKRADVYKLKSLMDRELVESGFLMGECVVIDNEEQAYTAFEGSFGDIQIETKES
jgi:hypothetical protein